MIDALIGHAADMDPMRLVVIVLLVIVLYLVRVVDRSEKRMITLVENSTSALAELRCAVQQLSDRVDYGNRLAERRSDHTNG